MEAGLELVICFMWVKALDDIVKDKDERGISNQEKVDGSSVMALGLPLVLYFGD